MKGKTCTEHADIFLLDAANDHGPTGWKFPLREQCAAVRSGLVRERKYRFVGRCVSTADKREESVSQAIAAVHGARGCEVLTAERLRRGFAVMSNAYADAFEPPERDNTTPDKMAGDLDRAMRRDFDDDMDVLLAMAFLRKEAGPTAPKATSKQRENEGKDHDVFTSVLTDKTVLALRFALDHPQDEVAQGEIRAATDRARAVEGTLDRVGSVTPFLEWITSHPGAGKAKCLLSLLVKWRDRGGSASRGGRAR